MQQLGEACAVALGKCSDRLHVPFGLGLQGPGLHACLRGIDELDREHVLGARIRECRDIIDERLGEWLVL